MSRVRGWRPSQAPYSEVARRGSPEPTSQRVSTAPSWGRAGAFTTVSNRNPGPRTARAAAPTSSFWVDAGARGASGARATTWVCPSCTTRHEGSPASTAPACWSRSTPGGGLAGAGAAAARGAGGGAVDVVPGTEGGGPSGADVDGEGRARCALLLRWGEVCLDATATSDPVTSISTSTGAVARATESARERRRLTAP